MTTSTTTPALVHKSLGIAGCKVLDEEHGIVEAYVSGIGNKDSGGDIIVPGAFDAHLPRRKPKGVWSHDWDKPVSKTLEIYEVSAGDPRLPMKMQLNNIGGLYVKTQFNMNTQLGRDAYETVRFYGDEAEWSIGYQVHDQEFDRKAGAMILKEIELYEYSPVLFGMNELTATVSIKVHKSKDGGLEYDVTGLNELETKAVSAALRVILEEKQVTVDSQEGDKEPEMSSEKVLTSTVRSAVQSALNMDGWVADIDPDEGYAIVEYYEDDDYKLYRVDFTLNSDGFAELGERVEVSERMERVYSEASADDEIEEKTIAPEGGEDMSDSQEDTSAKTDETEVEAKEEEVEEVEEKTDEPEVEAKEEEEAVEEKTEEDSDVEEKADEDVLLDTLVAKISRSVLEKIVDDLQSVLAEDEKSEEAEVEEKTDETEEEAKEDDSEVEAKEEEVEEEAKEEDTEVDEKDDEEEVEEKTDSEDSDEDAEEKSEEADGNADEKSDEGAEEKADEETEEKADEEVEAKEDESDEDSEEKSEEDEDSEEKSDDISDAEFLRGLAEFDEMLSDEL